MAEPPTKRAKIVEGVGSVDTVVFFLGPKPYKLKLKLPRSRGFSINEVKEAARSCGCEIELPDEHESGQFIVLRPIRPDLQVAVFTYSDTIGCSYVRSPSHADLPIPRQRHRELFDVLKNTETEIRVGSKFLYNTELLYTIGERDGQPTIQQPVRGFSCLPPYYVNEAYKMGEMLHGLKNALKEADGYSVSISGGDDAHHCPFSGGVDISILNKDSSAAAVVMTPLLQQSATPSENPAENPAECSKPLFSIIVENNVSEGVSMAQHDNVTLQLQANMMVLCSVLLKKILVKSPGNAESLNILSCYGLQIGMSCPLKILKLSIDFEKGNITYEELFSQHRCPFSHIYIDCALQHVISCF